MLFWLAELWVPANVYATGFYEKCGFAKDEGEILVKDLGWVAAHESMNA